MHKNYLKDVIRRPVAGMLRMLALAFVFCVSGINVSAADDDTAYSITIADASGGTVSADKATAKEGEEVTLTITPDKGLWFSSYVMMNENSEDISYYQNPEYRWYDGSNKLSFTMPASNINFIAEFSSEYNPATYMVHMPAAGTKQVTAAEGMPYLFVVNLPNNISSESKSADGKVVVTAPSGFKLTAQAQLRANAEGDYLDIFDGHETTSPLLARVAGATPETCISTGNEMTLHLFSNGNFNNLYMLAQIAFMETAKGNGTADDPYVLKTDYDWLSFVEKVNSGEQPNACARMEADLEFRVGYIGEVSSLLVGTEENPYSGVFDGNGHTLSIDGLVGEAVLAPFRYIDGATIKGLSVTNTLSSSIPMTYVGGIAARAVGKESKIMGCKVTSELNGQNITGGIVADAQAPLTIEDCLAGARYDPSKASGFFGGMIGNVGAEITISNCLVTTKFQDTGISNCTFYNGDDSKVTISNSFYTNGVNATMQGVGMGEETYNTLGKALLQLQNKRTDAPYWMQNTAKTENGTYYYPEPYRQAEADNIGTNYLYYNPEKKSLYVNLFEIDPEQDNAKVSIAPDVDLMAGTVFVGKRNFSRKGGETQLYTLCVPFDVTPTDSYKAYELSGVDNTTNTVSFKQVSAMQAAKPYLIEVSSDDVIISANDAMVHSGEAQRATAGNVAMAGNYNHMDVMLLQGERAYILQQDGVWHTVKGAGATAELYPSRAYLTFANMGAAKAFGTRLSDGAATGISGIKTLDGDGTVRYFDLGGKYVGTSLDGERHGVYINSNGKKVIKK